MPAALPPMPHADIVSVLVIQSAMGDESLPIAKRNQLAAHLADTYPQGLHRASEQCRRMLANPDLDAEVTATACSIIDQAVAIAEGRPWKGDE